MQITEKHLIKSFGTYRVMEGTVILDAGELRCCWVEDVEGRIKGGFTDIATATGVADALARDDDAHDSAGGDDAGSAGHGPDGGDGDGGGNGGD